ncbi:hypothetical protein VNI00_018300 [Paramarasmius palmivorus]|uniref:Alpha-type protein kinase domain-containing protein n=1 Tax=Paramarasmius palmivorus TaxID=297713 RepID=A0AAW0AYP2_9AGAR
MGQCDGCSLTFAGLDAELCSRCTKLGKPGLSEVEKKDILGCPACQNCSALYRFLQGDVCGPCVNRGLGNTQKARDTGILRITFDSGYISTSLTKRSEALDQEATEHRLYDKSKNEAKDTSALGIAAKKSFLRKAKKEDVINLEATLYFVRLGHLSRGTKKPVRVQATTSTVGDKIHRGSKVLPVLTNLFDRVKSNFENSMFATGLQPNERVNFGNHGVTFFMDSGSRVWETVVGSKFYAINLSEYEDKTWEDLFQDVAARSEIPGGGKDRRIPLAVSVPIEDLSELCDDDFTSQPQSMYNSPAPRSVPKSGKKAKTGTKRKQSSAGLSPPRISAPVRRSMALASSYTSAWQRRSSTDHSNVINSILEFETFEFKQYLCQVEDTGNTTIELSAQIKSIEVGKGWEKHFRAQKRSGAFLGKGMWKIAIKGRYEGRMMAILQYNPQLASNEDNRTRLLQELALLKTGEVLLKSFRERAASQKCTIPEIKWNSDVFVGTITRLLPPSKFPLEDGDDEDRSLVFDTFLAAPLLEIAGSGSEERKFSGNSQTGRNIDIIGQAIDAFAHHVVEETEGAYLFADIQGIVTPTGTTILYDPQAHSTQVGGTGPWDLGGNEIETFRKQHKCTRICAQLGLSSLQADPKRVW